MNDKVLFGDLLKDFETDDIDDDLEIDTVCCLIKASNETDVSWMVRRSGKKISSEEILGILETLAHSIREDLKDEWD